MSKGYVGFAHTVIPAEDGTFIPASQERFREVTTVWSGNFFLFSHAS
jgi:hypothetical protein